MDPSHVKIGQRVTSGHGEDLDAGRVIGVQGELVTVEWDSDAVTTLKASLLEIEHGGRGAVAAVRTITVDAPSGVTYVGTIDHESNIQCAGLPSEVRESIEEQAAWGNLPSGTVKSGGQTYSWSIRSNSGP